MKIILALLCILGMPVEAVAQPMTSPTDEVRLLTQAAAVGAKCRWLDAFLHDVVLLSRDEALTRIEAFEGPVALSDARTLIEQARATGQATACDGADAEQIMVQIQTVARGRLALWLARAEAYEQRSMREPWASDLTMLKASSATVAATLRSLASVSELAAIRVQAEREAATVLAAICPARRTVRYAGGRPCPPEPDARHTFIAKVLIESTERMAGAVRPDAQSQPNIP